MSAGVDSVYHLGQTGGKRVEGNFVARNSSRRSTPAGPASDGTTGVYGITVAAELAGMSVQALRLYERMRRRRTARVQRASRMTGRLYHLGGPLAALRDAALARMGGEKLRERYDWLYDWRRV